VKRLGHLSEATAFMIELGQALALPHC